ncbi:probable 2-oxoglutarate-dependent dioxygenase AOP1 [Sesamum indicum]|uniref:Probable 2-oxoglutarate-dependent dioxygenase AOP1 n=1 Tax=Sesamum indicum TaxID=4182 RepID=A0A6I9U9W7_SESIN|nr:probable 2-oxoglutarate-dependent dioxygenase AOP1 [Sesamum indicum]
MRSMLLKSMAFSCKNDDFPSELDQQVFDVTEGLFGLPLETKTRNSGKLGDHGYVGQLPHESMGIPDATTSDAHEAFTTLMWPSDLLVIYNYSARHQVLMKGDKPRYSLALFSYNHGTTHIPEELVDTEHSLQFKPFHSYGLLRFYLSRTPSDMSGSSAKEYCGIFAWVQT